MPAVSLDECIPGWVYKNSYDYALLCVNNSTPSGVEQGFIYLTATTLHCNINDVLPELYGPDTEHELFYPVCDLRPALYRLNGLIEDGEMPPPLIGDEHG